jgi:hypothetical protein
MKRKALFVFGAIVLALAVASGGFAANKWIITKSSQVKPGAIGYKNLSAAAKKKLRGARGAPGTPSLLQFGGQVNHGQTLCLGGWGANHQNACLGAAYASDNNSLVFGPMPAGLTIQNLTVMTSVAPDVGPVVVTVLSNGLATSLTCTIAKATTTCADSAHSFATAAGSFLEVRVANDPSNTVNNPRFIANFTY